MPVCVAFPLKQELPSNDSIKVQIVSIFIEGLSHRKASKDVNQCGRDKRRLKSIRMCFSSFLMKFDFRFCYIIHQFRRGKYFQKCLVKRILMKILPLEINQRGIRKY